MTLDSLAKLEDGDLRAVAARCEELLAQHDRERKNEAMEKARAILVGVGLNLRDVASGKARSGQTKTPAYCGGHQYQHPSDKTKVWAAKGQKPQWVRELEAEGKRPMEIPANDNIPPSLKKTG